MTILYTLFIYPIELIMNFLLEFAFTHTNSYGFSIILLSACINVLVIPLNLLAEKLAFYDKTVQYSMKDDIELIKKTFKGQEKHMMMRTLYRQYEYHPIFAIRASLGLLLQIPFFVAAYNLLGSYAPFENVSFLSFSSLSQADNMISLGNFHINVLPILMTIISLVTATVYTKASSASEKFQSYGLTFLFLVLLYTSPSGLVLYWTCNNVFYLIQNIKKAKTVQAKQIKYNSLSIKEIYKKKKSKIKIFDKLDNIALVVPLALLLSYFFMWSNNAHMFSFISIAISTVIALSLALLLWLGGELWKKIITFSLKKHLKVRNLINTFLFSGACALTLGIFCLAVIVKPNPIRPILVGVWVVIFAIILVRQVKYLNATMVFIIIISFLRLTSALLVIEKDVAQSQIHEPKTNFSEIKLIHKPNIYLFWLESYHDLPMQESVYGIDTEPMVSFLSDHKFMTYENVLSDGQATLVSFADLYSMGSVRAKVYGNLDVLSHIRNMLAGDDNNLVLRHLKANGYLTQATYLQHFLYVTGGLRLQNLDVTNYRTSELVYLQPLYNFVAGSLQAKLFTSQTGTLAEQVDYFMKNGLKSGQPFFISFKGGAEHTPDVGYSYKNADRWLAQIGYPSYIKKGNAEAKAIIDNIIANDPNALIILIGDHGSLRLRGAWKGNTVEDIKSYAQEINVPYEDMVHDTFNVHLSIRFPDKKEHDIAQGYYMSHVNLFTHLFAYLSENEELLKSRVTSESIYYGVSITKDGQILQGTDILNEDL